MTLVFLDWAILILLGLSLLWGYRNGLVRQVFHLFGIIIAYIIAFLFYDQVALFLKAVLPFPKLTDAAAFTFVTEIFQLEKMFYAALAFVLLFFITRWSLIYLSKILHLVTALPVLNLTNRLSGALLSFCTTFFILLILVNLFYLMPSPQIHKEMSRSKLVHVLIHQTPYFSDHFQKLWQKGLDHFEAKVDLH